MTYTEQTTKVKFQPLGNRVLAQRLEETDTLKGGIILPDTAKKKQEKMCIIAVGPGKKDNKGNFIPLPVQVGNVVLVEKYSGQEVSIDDEDYTIAKADDIIAIIEE